MCQCVRAKLLHRVRLCATLWTAARQSPSLSMGILRARILEWVAVPSSRGSSPPRDGNCISYVLCIGRQFLYHQCHMGTCVSIRNLLEEKHIKVLDSLPITLIRSFNKCLLTIYYVLLQTVKDREAWCAAVHGETESNTTEGLNNSSYVPGTRYPGKKKKVRQGLCSHGLYIPRDKTKLKYQQQPMDKAIACSNKVSRRKERRSYNGKAQ